MGRIPLARDTAPDAEQAQIARWREMTVQEKAALISGLCVATRELALAGIRSRHPGASGRESFLRLAALTLGVDLARRVYPDLAAVPDVP